MQLCICIARDSNGSEVDVRKRGGREGRREGRKVSEGEDEETKRECG